MPCDRAGSCADCQELRAMRDRRNRIETGVFFCPVAMQGNPTDPVKAEAI
jgi:hypothetical protein